MVYHTPKIFAIIGATCSGKSALSLQLAPLLNALIFSLDSLCIYKEIDIASAKPSSSELALIQHFAINVLYPNEHVSAHVFLQLLHDSIAYCMQKEKNLLIVGGSSFYLKAIIQGLSPLPNNTIINNADYIAMIQQPLQQQYAFLTHIDKEYAKKINANDTYRIHKALEIFFQTAITPTQFFIQNPATPFPLPIHTYNLIVERDLLHTQIAKRTNNMIANGILDEAQYLLAHYGETIQPFKSIGLKECLMVLQNKLNIQDLATQITTHTRQLAKRQNTFNRTQLQDAIPIHSSFDIVKLARDMLTRSL